ncbi:hypothetical protein BDQ12DRAFT_726318 [Crucibulum laeve]|uniref:F-box domain-containing protein n=1 Tax=Crucibulum laeve TaxID=68775 RepID=A0A5C3LQ55_9AGAR|nr:hypothetical protein BDQ12DRAFT_726318 [Crucibulum laeve]
MILSTARTPPRRAPLNQANGADLNRALRTHKSKNFGANGPSYPPSNFIVFVPYNMPVYMPIDPYTVRAPLRTPSRTTSVSRSRRVQLDATPVPLSPLEKRFAQAQTYFDNEDTPKRALTFDRLPVELQVEIFTHCLTPLPTFNINEAPLTVSQVCSPWRSLVLFTPKLWSSFQIEVQGTGLPVSVRDLHVITTMKLWLERSRNYPLSVRVVHTPVGRLPDTRSAQLLALLIPHARRWKYVEFVVPRPTMLALQDSMPDGFPALRSLTLQMKGLWHPTSPVDIRSFSIPWPQLTSLNLQLDSDQLLGLDECLDILSEASNLTHCTMNAECTFTSSGRRPEKVVLLNLERFHLRLQGGHSLGISDSPESQLVAFLDTLSFYKLHSLRLDWLVQSNEGAQNWLGVHQSFVSFLNRQSASLETLRMSYLPIGEQALIDCVVQLPLLMKLDLRFSLGDNESDPITDAFLKALTLPLCSGTMSDRVLVPLLESVYLQSHGSAFETGTLLDMIRSRWKLDNGHVTTQKLRKFHLRSMRPASDEIQGWKTNCHEAGLDFVYDTVMLR